MSRGVTSWWTEFGTYSRHGTACCLPCAPAVASPPPVCAQLDILVNFVTGVVRFNADTGLWETSYDLLDVALTYARCVLAGATCTLVCGQHTQQSATAAPGSTHVGHIQLTDMQFPPVLTSSRHWRGKDVRTRSAATGLLLPVC
jgi:hypothetical protein